jgi:Ca2+-binding RTX toxin-like protein
LAYNITGTPGNDTLNQAADSGPGTLAGLAGDDCLFTGSALATVTGDPGNDTVVLQAGNTGTVNGGTGDDSVTNPSTIIGSMLLLGGDGADSLSALRSTANQTIVGGNDSGDAADSIEGGGAEDFIFGNGGNDFIFDPGGSGTIYGGFGNDQIIDLFGRILGIGNSSGVGLFFGNEGADSIGVSRPNSTVVGGNDSADGSDSITSLGGRSFLLGNGGADTILTGVLSGNQSDTVVGGFGNDSIFADGLIFGNEGNDTVRIGGSGTHTVFGGQGNDSLDGANILQGDEGNDTIHTIGINTITGGSGNDVFFYFGAAEDGNNAAANGPVQFITDVSWAEDRFRTPAQVTFAANVTGMTSGVNLTAQANSAIAAAFTLAGGGSAMVAAQFTFNGRTYLAIDNQNGGPGVLGQFDDANDLLLDITGATGSIGTSSFIT